jgi:serine/threonine-protein kinase
MQLKQVGRYQILKEIGRGGMATVYLAYDPQFERQVAIKLQPREFLHDPNFLARFSQEAHVIARLEHRNILPVYDYGEADGVPYIVMRYMPHGSLRDRLDRASGTGLPISEINKTIHQVAEALDFAHKKNVIHRDLKPGNVLVDEDGNAYLSDFGIAKVIEATMSFSGTLVVGTPSYMAPEQVRGGKPSPRTDVYALGAMLFELLVGHPPFEADETLALAYLHVNEPVPQLGESRPEAPAGMQEVVERAMAKKPGDRYGSASELEGALSTVIAGVTVVADPKDVSSTAETLSVTQIDALPIPVEGEDQTIIESPKTQLAGVPAVPAPKTRLETQGAQPSPFPAPELASELEPRKRRWSWWVVGAIIVVIGLGGIGYLSVSAGLIPFGGDLPFALGAITPTNTPEAQVTNVVAFELTTTGVPTTRPTNTIEPTQAPTSTTRPTTRPTNTPRSAVQPTNTPAIIAVQPSPTPTETEAVCPPNFTVVQSAFCREGPGQSYKHAADVVPGDEPFITLIGRNKDGGSRWWYLETLRYDYKISCWVSDVALEFDGGDTSCLPIIEPSPSPTPVTP